MSNLCNLCDLNRTKEEAEKSNLGVTIFDSAMMPQGKEIFVHPKNIKISKDAMDADHPQHKYFRACYMKVSKECACNKGCTCNEG